jgi:hypothetical protein
MNRLLCILSSQQYLCEAEVMLERDKDVETEVCVEEGVRGVWGGGGGVVHWVVHEAAPPFFFISIPILKERCYH